LKKMAVLLNTSTYKGEDGKEMLFYTGKKLKTIAISKEDLAKNFDAAVKGISDEVVNDLPEAIIDFYNDNFAEDEAAAAAPAPEKPVEKKAVEKPAKVKAEKAPKEKKTGEKKVVELSVFGHKVGTQASALDDLINSGKAISLDELSKKSGRSALGVKSHIKHLISARGLKIEEKDGMYKLVK
jgi:biotin operon repressor